MFVKQSKLLIIVLFVFLCWTFFGIFTLTFPDERYRMRGVITDIWIDMIDVEIELLVGAVILIRREKLRL